MYLRDQLDDLNLQLLNLINKRAEVVQEIGRVKEKQGVNRFDPVRERAMLDQIENNHEGPLDLASIKHIFKEIFKLGLDLQDEDQKESIACFKKTKSRRYCY